MTKSSSILLITVFALCVVQKYSAFTIFKLMNGVARHSSSSSNLHDVKRDFLHEAEYPGDDFTHILGFSDCDHEPSKLQEIATKTLKDVARNKLPVDTVSFHLVAIYRYALISIEISSNHDPLKNSFLLPTFSTFLLHDARCSYIFSWLHRVVDETVNIHLYYLFWILEWLSAALFPPSNHHFITKCSFPFI